MLDLTPCGECENDLCAEQLRKELTRLVEFFGPTVFEARFTLAYELEDAPYHVKELSRREMMEQLTEGSKSGTKSCCKSCPACGTRRTPAWISACCSTSAPNSSRPPWKHPCATATTCPM